MFQDLDGSTGVMVLGARLGGGKTCLLVYPLYLNDCVWVKIFICSSISREHCISSGMSLFAPCFCWVALDFNINDYEPGFWYPPVNLTSPQAPENKMAAG